MDKKKTLLLTGGTRGIGLSLLKRFLENPIYQIAYAYKNSVQICTDINSIYGNRAIGFQGDLKDPNFCCFFVDKSIEIFGSIDGLINNSGIALEGLLELTPKNEIKELLSVNIEGPLYLTQKAIPALRQSKNSPYIINMSSIWGALGASCETVYAMSKGALNQMTRSLANELGPCGIRTIGIAPGLVDTDMIHSLSKEDLNYCIDKIPLKRIAKPSEIANLTYFLAEQGTYLNGETITIDGGYSLS